ncbi:MAG: sensor histidine kinase, partial [Bacilli bacterium]
DQLLVLARLDAADGVISKRDFPFRTQLQSIVLSLESLWGDKNIDLTFDVEMETAYGNEAMLHHVWYNLIANACTHTPANGTLHIVATERKDWLEVQIQDSGCGIPTAHLPHIFGRFYQVNQIDRGAGLGLSIADKVVKLHGGIIEATSVVGEGTTMTVTLPLRS